MSMDWSKSKYFKESEFVCSHTGKCEMKAEFIARLDQLRGSYGKPLTISSGFRDSTHPIEAKKKGKGGSHTTGQAADIFISREEAFKLLSLAFNVGFTGIGINQKGGARFIHLDILKNSPANNKYFLLPTSCGRLKVISRNIFSKNFIPFDPFGTACLINESSFAMLGSVIVSAIVFTLIIY